MQSSSHSNLLSSNMNENTYDTMQLAEQSVHTEFRIVRTRTVNCVCAALDMVHTATVKVLQCKLCDEATWKVLLTGCSRTVRVVKSEEGEQAVSKV